MTIIDAATGNLCSWTIYERPLGAPNLYVARQFIIARGLPIPTNHVLFGDTLDEIRWLLNRMYPGLVCFARNEGDSPSIVETWL
jgi:hypothetical protein